MDIFNFVESARYIIYAIGAIGLFLSITGIYKNNHTLIQRGAMVIVATIVLLICGYIIMQTAPGKADEYIMREFFDY